VGKSDAFDRLTELAAALFGAPVALITSLETERQWFRSTCGYDRDHTPLEDSFCRHMIGSPAGSVMVVEDATQDPRFKDNRLVTGEGVRFYAGAVITTADAEQDGAICVLDVQPRVAPTEAQLESLKLLALLAGQEIDRGRQLEAGRRHRPGRVVRRRLPHPRRGARPVRSLDRRCSVILSPRRPADCA
jgi:GAF domain-containing protein